MALSQTFSSCVAADRCKGTEMDAAVVNEEGIPYFFKSKSVSDVSV